ncbi:general substrate transporter [Lichtheimia corymbifera JMRC:FSU:9682]|uniref:General substrate transporter n=1 Tax=Lichtheimia corymbifera JMRC:FSU:9682 TaxID=1263082 RepID=A0A068RT35_9FUNG|nr:general substrate transporter [Lichtheimia corymbifera JMRC:FSU:9682]
MGKACFAKSYSIPLVTVIVVIIVTHQPAYLMQLSGPVADHIGRRNYFFVATIVKIIGSMIEITASNFATLLLGRILAGAAIGPRWLIYKTKRRDEALAILTRLRSGQDISIIQMECTSIEQDVAFDAKYASKGYWTLLEKGIENNRRRTLLGIGIHALTQLTGINVLLFYLPHILQSTGITEVNSELLGNGVSGMVNMLATIPVFSFIDKCDRRRILIRGSLVMGVCMMTIAVMLGVFHDSDHNALGMDDDTPNKLSPRMMDFLGDDGPTFAVLALLCLFITCFALSWGPLGWIYPAEIYPQLIRAKAMGLTTAASYCFNVTISQIAPVLFRTISWGTYVVFGCFCLLIAWIVHSFYPETRGRSLEEIHLIFSNAILMNERADAHHPSTAAEALEHLEIIDGKHHKQRQHRRHHHNNNNSKLDDASA